MYKNQKSIRGGIQDFLCPFTDMFITQGSNYGTHKGTMANDIRGLESGIRYPYYAPCDCRLIWFDKSNGQGMWQSINPVRFSNGKISFATFVTAHDNTFNADEFIGKTIYQGEQLGNMGNKAGNGGFTTGIHCHIEIAQENYSIQNWHKNIYGIWCFPNETDTDDCYFMDNTNILNGMGGNWKYLKDVKVEEEIDQILHVGSHVKLTGTYTVKEIDVPNNKAKINVEGEDIWLSSIPLLEVK